MKMTRHSSIGCDRCHPYGGLGLERRRHEHDIGYEWVICECVHRACSCSGGDVAPHHQSGCPIRRANLERRQIAYSLDNLGKKMAQRDAHRFIDEWGIVDIAGNEIPRGREVKGLVAAWADTVVDLLLRPEGSITIGEDEVDDWFVPWLWLHGPLGDGKTSLASRACNEITARTVSVAEWANVSIDFYRRIRQTWDDDAKESEQNVVESLINVPILMLDDLGKALNTEWQGYELTSLIDPRYRNARSVMIVTSNQAPDDPVLTALGDGAPIDRLRARSLVIEMPDYSFRNAFQGSLVERMVGR